MLVLASPVETRADSFVPSTAIDLQDEGVSQGQVKKLNCSGAGITCSRSGVVGTLTVPGGGGPGGGNYVDVVVNFGATGKTVAKTVVTGQAWVGLSSQILCVPSMMATADRTDGMEDALIEGLTITAYARVAGTGFTVAANPRSGKAYGKFLIQCTGA